MAQSALPGLAVLALTLWAVGHVTWQQWVRLHWELKARGSGISTPGRVVGARTVGFGEADRATYYRIRFTTAEGHQVEVEDELSGRGALEGIAVTVTYHPARPERASVVSRYGPPGWVTGLLIVLVLTPVTLGLLVLLSVLVTHG